MNDLLKLNDVLQLIPVSRSSWYLGIKDGYYPTPINVGVRAVAWVKDDILKLIDDLKKKKIRFDATIIYDIKSQGVKLCKHGED